MHERRAPAWRFERPSKQRLYGPTAPNGVLLHFQGNFANHEVGAQSSMFAGLEPPAPVGYRSSLGARRASTWQPCY
jgi:hypothetical protein